MDTAMAEDEVLKDELAGSTAVVVLLKDKKMYETLCGSHTFYKSLANDEYVNIQA